MNARSQQETPHSSKSRPETQSKTPKPTSSRSDAETPKSSRPKFRFKNIPRNDDSEETDMSEWFYMLFNISFLSQVKNKVFYISLIMIF